MCVLYLFSGLVCPTFKTLPFFSTLGSAPAPEIRVNDRCGMYSDPQNTGYIWRMRDCLVFLHRDMISGNENQYLVCDIGAVIYLITSMCHRLRRLASSLGTDS